MHNNSQINTIIEHIKSEYNTRPEFLWPDRYPGYAVFRHSKNKNHMNKNNWTTIWFDGTLSDEMVFELIRKSYLLSDK